MENSNYWGKHLLLDCGDCDRDSIKSETNLKVFLMILVQRINMKAYGDPILAHFATHDPSKGGYTICQMIETSLIDGHFVDETGDAYISIHSCKDFDVDVVKSVVQQFFNPKTIKDTVIYRKT